MGLGLIKIVSKRVNDDEKNIKRKSLKEENVIKFTEGKEIVNIVVK